MKKFFFLLFILFSTPIFAFSQQALVNQLQRPQNVQGDFTQSRYLKSLAKPIVTSGQFTLVKNKGLLWQMEKPFATNLRVTPNGIQQWNGTTWVGNQNIAQSQQISLFLGLLNGDISALSSQFDITLSGSQNQWTLKLTPNSLIMKQIFNHIQLKGDNLVREIELNEIQGDRTVIQFTQLVTDKTLGTFTQSAFDL